MSPLARWILAGILSVVLIACVLGVAVFGVMALAFGSDSCDQIGGGASSFLLVASPALMIVGVLVSAVLFGLNKRWQWWVGSLAVGVVLGAFGYVLWFILVANVWCV